MNHVRDRIFKTAFAVWLILWAHFMLRELFKKGYFHDYKALLARSLDGKRSYVTGDDLYAFLTFCNKNLPAGATYRIIGLKAISLDKRRATYYLYPHVEEDHPDFILVFNEPAYVNDEEYEILARLDDNRYILKKRRKN